MVEKLVEIGILFDFYGKILSKRQYTTVELYYIYDFSLSEIGEELNISRQSIYDTLQRAEQNLYEYEDMLGLVSKFDYTMKEINKIGKIVEEIEEQSIKIGNEDILTKSKDLKRVIKELVDKS